MTVWRLVLIVMLVMDTAQATEGVPRTVVDAARYPFSAIGRLNASGEGFCTAVLVGRNTALTAAHCLYDARRSRWRAAGDIHFVAGYQRGTWLAHSVVQSYRTGLGGSPVPRQPTADFARRDWAVLELEKPVGGHVGWLATGDINGEPLFEAGYRRDRPYAVSIGGRCKVLGAVPGGDAIAHDCDVIKGGSGSPLMAMGADGVVRVVAINSMRLNQADGAVTVASQGAGAVVGARTATPPRTGSVAAGAAYLRGLLGSDQ